MLEPVVFIAVFAGLVANGVLKVRRQVLRSKATVKMMEDGDVQGFLKQIELDMELTPRHLHRQLLMVNKAAGLCCIGRFEEAWGALKDLPVKRFPKLWKTLYYNNLLNTLLLLKRTDEARALMAQHGHLFTGSIRHKPMRQAAQSTLAVYEWHVGDRTRARGMLMEAAALERPVFYSAGPHYYLGLQAEEAGDMETARRYFHQVVDEAPQHWTATEAAKKLAAP